MAKVQIGSVSSGTLRSEDLLQAFGDELERVSNGEYAQLIEDARRDDLHDDDDADIVNELQDALNQYAPPHTYFGAHPGDGADFGFWPDGDFERCNRHTILELRSGAMEFLDLDCELYVIVSDHGNIEVFTIGPGESVWSAV